MKLYPKTDGTIIVASLILLPRNKSNQCTELNEFLEMGSQKGVVAIYHETSSTWLTINVFLMQAKNLKWS